MIYLLRVIRAQFANWGIKRLLRVDRRIKYGVKISSFLICADEEVIESFARRWDAIKGHHPLRRMILSRPLALIKTDFPVYGFSLVGVTFFTSNQISDDAFDSLLLQCAFKNYIDRHREKGILASKSEEYRIKNAFQKYCRICRYGLD